MISLTLHGAAAAAYMIHPQLLSGAGGNPIATGSTVTVSVVVDSLTEEAPPAPVPAIAVLTATEPTPVMPATPPLPNRTDKTDDAPLETATADATVRAKTEPDTPEPAPVVAPPPAPISQPSPPPVAAPATATAAIQDKVAPAPARAAASASQGDMLRYSGKIRSKLAAHRPVGIGQKGRVIVTFTVGSTGAVEAIDVSLSSGSQRLDRIVLASIRSASPFPQPPERADTGQRTFSIPFDFR